MTKKQYIVGVDGGNTKTDYLLYDIEGNFIDGLRSGTCSHEAQSESFEGAYKIMKQHFDLLLGRHHLTPQDIAASVYGLAGVDVPFQKENMEKVIERLGFTHYQVVNDGFLGIKAASPTGVGACSINGTGTVNVGIDETGKWIQVGGIGYVSGDEAGGSFLARRTIQAAYDECFRFGRKTLLTQAVFQMYHIQNRDAFGNAILSIKMDATFLIQSLCNCANAGDEVAIEILAKAGENMARSTAGVITALSLTQPVPVILAGSVWAKATSDVMIERFKEVVQMLSQQSCQFIVLNEPPVIGAILWALELAQKTLPNDALKTKVLKSIIEYQQQY